MKKVLLTGGTGFVGQKLALALVKRGYQCVILTRNPLTARKNQGPLHTYLSWDAMSGPPSAQAFEGVTHVVNLMGEGVAEKRWSSAQKNKIYQSRVTGTHHLVAGVLNHGQSVQAMVSASATGFYDHSQPGPVDEDSPGGKDFLAGVCRDWEAESKKVASKAVREVRIRIGVVLGDDGGALSKMERPFLWGIAGKLGHGKQWMNWIHVDDLVALMIESIENDSFSGAYNGVAPNNVSNRDFTKEMGRLLQRPTLFPVPAFVLKGILGEMSTIVLSTQKVESKRLESTGFIFQYKDLKKALQSCLRLKKMDHLSKRIRCHKLAVAQFLPHPITETFSFFSDAYNLEKITPSYLKFKVEKQSTESIQEGTVFDYSLRLRGLPVRWQSKILDWQENERFVDVQLKGPYRVWHHTHLFTELKDGTLIEDSVYFALPRLFILSFFVAPFVKRDVGKIFEYRKKMIEKHFSRS